MNIEQLLAQQQQQASNLQSIGLISFIVYALILLVLSYALFEALRSFTRWMDAKASTERAMQQYLRTRSGPSKPEAADDPLSL